MDVNTYMTESDTMITTLLYHYDHSFSKWIFMSTKILHTGGKITSVAVVSMEKGMF